MMLSDVYLTSDVSLTTSDVCRVHPAGGRHVRPASIGSSGPARPGSRLQLRASVAGAGAYCGGLRTASYIQQLTDSISATICQPPVNNKRNVTLNVLK